MLTGFNMAIGQRMVLAVEERLKAITGDTLVPLWLAVTVIGAGAAWITKIDVALDAQAAKIEEQQQTDDARARKIFDLLRQIEHRLSVIEGEIKRIKY
jgi:hypothetical protein